MMATNTISTHPRDDSVGTFRNSVALVWPLWLEGRCQASNVEVVAGDLFATPNPLISHTQKNLLSPFSNIRAITPKLGTRSSLAMVEEHGPSVSALLHRPGVGSLHTATIRERA